MTTKINTLFTFGLTVGVAIILAAVVATGAIAAEGTTGTSLANLINQLSPLVITVSVPLIIIAIKKALPNIPTVLLPIAAPFVGILGDFLVTVVTGWAPAGGMVVAAAAGALGVFLREVVDQTKKAIPT